MSSVRTHIGTSGWHYQHWRGSFYPDDLPSAQMLPYYAQHLRTVEVNNSFYRLPDEHTFAAWRDATPEDFTFAVKASRYITHMKKLGDPEEPISTFLGHARALGNKLGPVLFQLPPRWRVNIDRLRAFLAALPPGIRFAFEFRERTWYTSEVYEALAQYRAALCIHDMHGAESPQQVVTDWVYLRLHGPERGYQGRYTTEQLATWADALSAWQRQGLDTYCYFNNDVAGHAVAEALELREMLAARAA